MEKLFLSKQEEIEERAKVAADYIIKTECTIRECASHMHISKSTIHKDMKKRLKNIDGNRAKKVARILEKNLNERHIRGGLTTQKKYKRIREFREAS